MKKEYSSPKIQVRGDLRSLTQGQILPVEFDDSTYFWGATNAS